MKTSDVIRKEILALPAYHLDEHPGIKLNQNESPWDLPVEIKTQVLEELVKIPWNRYPLGDTIKIKKKLAKHLDVWPDQLVLSNGSNVLIQALILATSVKGKVMVFDPTFSVYELQGKILGNKIIRISLNEDFSIPLEETLQTIKAEKPNIIFIANPNAPTGNLLSVDSLQRILHAAPGLVVIDEAYFPFSKFSVLEWQKNNDHLVVLRTFSKAYALGGVRFGYAVMDSDLALEVEKCLLPFCISRLTLATVGVLIDSTDYVAKCTLEIIEERNRVFAAMSLLSGIKVYPSDTNFILFEVKNSVDVFKSLLEKGVVVRQVSDGRRLKEALRVSIGTPEENNAFLKALEASV